MQKYNPLYVDRDERKPKCRSGTLHAGNQNNRLLCIQTGVASIHLKFCRPGFEDHAVHLQVYSLDGVTESLNKAYKLFTEGKFSNALQAFNQVLWTIPLVVVSSRREVDEVKELITICRSATPLCHINCCLHMQSCCGDESAAVSC